MSSNTQRILGINTFFDSISYKGFVNDSFRSHISFMDFDAVIIDTCCLAHEYEADYPTTYHGKRMISKDDSHRMVEEFSLMKKQIEEVLRQGKNVFILMTTNEPCFVYTGRTEFSGTGKNARASNIVNEFDPFSFLPIKLKPTMVSGENFNICCQAPYASFFQTTKDIISYDAYFEASEKELLLTIPNSNKVIAAVFEYEKGRIIVLPYPYNEEYFETEKEWKKSAKRYLDALFELNHALLSTADYESLPLWSEGVKILNEKEEETNLEKDQKKLQSLKNKIEKHKEQIRKIQKKKLLITSSGTPLEEIVKEVLQELSFTLRPSKIGRSDVVASYGKTDIVAEIKGVTKSAAEKHAAQLEKWVSEFIEENNHAPKPLLIVNGYCDTPLTERTEEVFPNQMLKYSEAREHALITTTQLLCLYTEIKKDPSCAESRIKELLSCVGKYQRYLDYDNYLLIEPNKENP